jgi:peroxiredoxin
MIDRSAPTDQQKEVEAITSSIPVAIGQRIDAGVSEIDSSGEAPGLSVGDRAPDFTLFDAWGEAVTLAQALISGPVILTFYRGEWCPFCNIQLRHLERALSRFRELGATLIAISPQAPDHGVSLTEKLQLTFPVLSDPAQAVIRSYKLQFTLSGDLEELQVNVFGNDPAKQNANGTRSLPVPGTFVIDSQGIIRAAFVDADWRRRVEPSEIEAVLEQL